jgi:hypothetical protein
MFFSTQARTTARKLEAPIKCPTFLGMNFFLDHLPLPSMMMAMCLGNELIFLFNLSWFPSIISAFTAFELSQHL